ncbi:aminotransferase class I/II-fold pyridoxal phosphate-dependent enzyme, partial [Subsaximicrobium wynnwilliamsii]
MDSKIWLSSPHLGTKERAFINEAFQSNWIAPSGKLVDGFESDISNYLGNEQHVAALNSGTAAIHLALVLLNVAAGDEVLCQSHTFAASANPIIYQGATPIFIDSEALSWNLCPELLEQAIKDRIKKGKTPKAIIAVHLYGMPYQVDEIQAIAAHYNIPIIEDSAEAFGSRFENKMCGTFGSMAILSFNGNKIITTSAGGALITKDKFLRDKAVFLATQAKDDHAAYTHSNIGYNYRMSNVLAGIGRAQMEVLDSRVTARRNNFKVYSEALAHLSELKFQQEPKNCVSNRWLTCVLTPSEEVREGLRKHLESLNIESRPFWRPMHLQPVFKDAPA